MIETTLTAVFALQCDPPAARWGRCRGSRQALYRHKHHGVYCVRRTVSCLPCFAAVVVPPVAGRVVSVSLSWPIGPAEDSATVDTCNLTLLVIQRAPLEAANPHLSAPVLRIEYNQYAENQTHAPWSMQW